MARFGLPLGSASQHTIESPMVGDGKHASLTVLGIETSCDETAAALVRRNEDGSGEILAKRGALAARPACPLWRRGAGDRRPGPCRASRPASARAMEDAGVVLGLIGGLAATARPGLIGGADGGSLHRQGDRARPLGLPLLAVNHLEGHALTPAWSDGSNFPIFCCWSRAGIARWTSSRSWAAIAAGLDDRRCLGRGLRQDSKFLGLPYPGGPAVEKWPDKAIPSFSSAAAARPARTCHFSFSGLKTAGRKAQELSP